MLEFENIEPNFLYKYEHLILNLESTFPKEIMSSIEDYKDVLLEPCIAKIAKFNSIPVGNIMGYPLEGQDLGYHDLEDYEHIKEAFYLFSFVVDPAFQGKGFGKTMMIEFLKEAKEKGYKKVVGHFRPNNSLFIARKFNAKEIKICHNWENTGEDYVLCEIDVDILTMQTVLPTISN